MSKSRKKQIILTVLAVFIGTLVIHQYNNKANDFTDLSRNTEMETEAPKTKKLKLDGSYCSSDSTHQYNNKTKVSTDLCRVSEMKTEASEANKLKLNWAHCVSDYDDEKLASLVGCPWNEHPGCSHFPVKVI